MLEKLVAQGLDRTDFIKLAHGSRFWLTAYDDSIYGAMPVMVVQVGVDSIANERGERFQLACVQTE